MQYSNWKNFVPVTKHDAVHKAFEHAFGTTQVDDIVPLTDGRSSALVYKVTLNQKAYVMRLVMQIDALRDPHRQFVCLNSAAQAGIAPPVHYTNAEDAVSIVDFIEHTPLSERFTSNEALFGELATRIKAIHSLPLFPQLVGFLDGVESLIPRFQSLRVLPPSATEEHFRYYGAVQRAYPRNQGPLVSSHNDLNPTNILHNGGRIWIIDWEAAFANDCYVDLAIVNIFFGAGEHGEDTLLNTYFGESLSEYHHARFFLIQQVCFMYISMLFMQIAASSAAPNAAIDAAMETMRLQEFYGRLRSGEISIASPDEHLHFAKVLLNESLSQMKTARFQEAIRLVTSASN